MEGRALRFPSSHPALLALQVEKVGTRGTEAVRVSGKPARETETPPPWDN